MNQILEFINSIREIFNFIHSYKIDNYQKSEDSIVNFLEKNFPMTDIETIFALHHSAITKGTRKIYFVLDYIYRRGMKNILGKEKYFDIEDLDYQTFVYYKRNKDNTKQIEMVTYRVNLTLKTAITKTAPYYFYETLYVYSYHLLLINKFLLHIRKMITELPNIGIKINSNNFVEVYRRSYNIYISKTIKIV